MSRRTKDVVGTSERDHGKVYVITEAPAWQAEEWLVRAALAAGGRLIIPPELAVLGPQGFAMAIMGTFGGTPFELVKPLIDEMMRCVQLRSTSGVVRAIVETDIEDVVTRGMLKREVLELHMGFTIAELLSMLAPSAPDSAPDTTTTSTSLESAEH